MGSEFEKTLVERIERHWKLEWAEGKTLTCDRQKKIVIIAGPNGAGKTTFAREFLPNEANCPIFVNAD